MIILWESANVALARESASILIATKSASTVQAREIASVFFVAKIKEITKHTLPQPTATLHLSEPSCTQPEISLPHTSATSRDMKMVMSLFKKNSDQCLFSLLCRLKYQSLIINFIHAVLIFSFAHFSLQMQMQF